MRGVVAAGLVVWVGATLVLSRVRWFARTALVDRLRPFASGAPQGAPEGRLLSAASFRDVVRPLAVAVGEVVGRLVGTEDVADRLIRLHSPLDVAAFRLRQVARSACTMVGGLLLVAALRPPVPVALVVSLGTPVLAFLLGEQALSAASSRRQKRLAAELPVVAEQLAMLLGSGWSLGGALQRLAQRGTGVAAQDLGRVVGRIGQGVAEGDALQEWVAIARVSALDRLVPVLALNRLTVDLGRLLADEARAMREEHHRHLIERLDRRGQQVWIPVTVATLVPGSIFLTIPFLEALRLFTGS